MLSSPRKPPSNTLLPVGVLAVHPPREVEEQLLEDPLEELVVTRTVDLEDPQRGPRVHGRVDVAERPTRTRAAGRSGACTTRGSSRSSWSLANCGSTWASGTQWNARSHAAYQGYSHVSGIEITSALLRWRHSWLRPARGGSAGGGGRAGSPSSQRSTSKWKNCLLHSIPATAWRSTSRLVGAGVGRRQCRRRTRRPRARGRRSTARRVRVERPCRRPARRSRISAVAPGRHRRRGTRARPSCPARSG